ncbi:MAG: hypothetical protein GY854_17495 [Deltaproteobacteria bacterium]|nr:hypothetical protein [Deltaproteobacteria bacterium]
MRFMMKNLILLAIFVVCCSGCVPTPVSSPGYVGSLETNIKSKPKEVLSRKENPIITIGAGYVEVGTKSYWNAWYLIDRRTKLCWMKVGASLCEMDCCSLMNIDVGKQYLKWLTSEKCSE